MGDDTRSRLRSALDDLMVCVQRPDSRAQARVPRGRIISWTGELSVGVVTMGDDSRRGPRSALEDLRRGLRSALGLEEPEVELIDELLGRSRMDHRRRHGAPRGGPRLTGRRRPSGPSHLVLVK